MYGPESNDNPCFPHEATPTLASQALTFSTDADATRPATFRVLSILVSAVRTSESGLVRKDKNGRGDASRGRK